MDISEDCSANEEENIKQLTRGTKKRNKNLLNIKGYPICYLKLPPYPDSAYNSIDEASQKYTWHLRNINKGAKNAECPQWNNHIFLYPYRN